MSLFREGIGSICCTGFDFAREATLRDESRPQWFNYFLAICYYALPVTFLVVVFISWKLTMIVAVTFIASLIAGAMTEADDVGAK